MNRASSESDGVPFGVQLHHRACSDPDGVGLVTVALDGSESFLTWHQLDRRANQWGRAMADAGVRLGALVALAIPNSEDLVLSILGCWKIGAVPIPMRWDIPDWERCRLLDVIDAALVVDEYNRAALATTAAHASDGILPETLSPNAYGICSSGSTGLPKVILCMAPGVWTPAHSEPFMMHWANVSQPQVILVPGPMYHTNGFVPLNFLLGGDRLVVLERFSAATVLDIIERYRVTNFTATPTMLKRIAAVPRVAHRDLSSVEWILQGAAAMPPALLHNWFELLSPERILMAYGMSEGLGLTALRGDEWLQRPGSVGRGFRDTEIRILDDNGETVPTGEIGEIYLRSSMIAAYRYIGGAPQPPATKDGFHTAGDIGRLDAGGYLYIADRRTDMIITGGANVFPAEVESALSEHPEIADVVVLGLVDPEWGRRVHAVIQPADPSALTEQQVIRYAKGRLAPYKVPKTVEFVDEIPRTAATKVNRAAMIQARGG
ncbi:class I adenylate-forming enzyme family protein [Mycobacterium sp.]|uniref:class I adenylate-forming enzyme family protein n=1 Tax=Mycobacterium sp. TaxID=1785 RepID=UPI003C751173